MTDETPSPSEAAKASPPDASIFEKAFDLGGDEEMSPSDLDALYAATMQDFREGEVVRGTVVDVSTDRVLVDIGYKSEGVIDSHEFPAPEELKVGDQFDIYIEAPEDDQGMPILSKLKADRIKNWAHIQDIYEADGTIEGKIVRRVKGGLKVDIGIDAFMPASQLTWRPTGDLDRYIGQSMELKIIKLTKRRRNVVVSRRKLLEEQRAGEKQRLLDTIEIGKVIPGEVKNITDFGAFVDVGGIDGLLHVTDMSWGRVKHPSHAVSVGEHVEVVVLNFDPQSERISLGLKQKTENPWTSVEKHYPVGTVVRGKVVSMTDYGAFIQLEEGIEGMVHVSEMSWTRRVRHPSEIVGIEEDVDVMILSVSPEEEKIALGVKQTQPNPWMEIESKYPVGSVVKGIVRNIADYGAFVQIEEGIDGLLHVSDLSWTQKVNHPSELLEKGQEIDVKILNIDPSHEKIGVGLKQLDEDPWDKVSKSIQLNSDVEVEIAKLVSFGAFARLEGGVEGLIHVSEIGEDNVEKPEDVLSIGDKVTARVISIDPVDRKIGLSIRAYKKNELADVTADHSKSGDDSAVSIRDAVGDAVPASLLGAGGTFTDAANELMASVRGPEETKADAAQQEQEASGTDGEPVKQTGETEAGEAEAVVSETPPEKAEEPSDAPESEDSDD